METSVIITFIVCCLIGWIAFLIYKYNSLAANIKDELTRFDYIKRYTSLREVVNDLINSINSKLPGSTLEYISDDKGEHIEGNLKYNI